MLPPRHRLAMPRHPLAGRADRSEFGELVAMVKEAADVIDRGGLFFGFSERLQNR